MFHFLIVHSVFPPYADPQFLRVFVARVQSAQIVESFTPATLGRRAARAAARTRSLTHVRTGISNGEFGWLRSLPLLLLLAV